MSNTSACSPIWLVLLVTLSASSCLVELPERDPPPTTVVFGDATGSDFPGTLQDTYINNLAVNYSADTILCTYTWPTDQVVNAIVFKSDLSAIPPAAILQSAALYLYFSAMEDTGGDNLYRIAVHRIVNVDPVITACDGDTYDGTNPWTPVPSRDHPLAQADIAQADDIVEIDKIYGYKSWDVTAMVQSWVSEPQSNYGMLVNGDPDASADSNRYFRSTESPIEDERPRLEVVYLVPAD